MCDVRECVFGRRMVCGMVMGHRVQGGGVTGWGRKAKQAESNNGDIWNMAI